MARSIFVTATDTDAGKTWVTAKLLEQYLAAGEDAQALKPIASGATLGVNEDVAALLAVQAQKSAADINFFTYTRPVAPALAANIEGSPLQIQQLLDWVKAKEAESNLTLIEGVGGLMVPLVASQGKTWLVSDWLNAMPHAEVMLVAPLRLGCMNQILLSCMLLSQLDRAPKWIVLNDINNTHSAEETLQTIQPFLEKMFSVMPHIIYVEKNADIVGVC